MEEIFFLENVVESSNVAALIYKQHFLGGRREYIQQALTSFSFSDQCPLTFFNNKTRFAFFF